MTNASVIINEIAWMGNDTSANDEWIELYNNGSSAVLIDEWLLSDGINLDVVLTGSIGVGEYVVLERTDDDSAPGDAFLIYTGALANTGATLTLKNGNGAIQDQVGGGEHWEQVGGDNTTKETAQYTSAGWITAVATPGKVNAAKDSVSDESGNDKSSVPSKGSYVQGTTKKTVALTIPDVDLSLTIEAPDITYVHQPISFEVDPSGLGDVIMDSLQYEWNFGDLRTKKKKGVTHMYEYPGEYVVVVHASFARHEQIERHKIVVLPVSFSITRTQNGDVQIHNDAKYEVDISDYVIQGHRSVTLPSRSILLAGGTLTIPKTTLAVSPFSIVTLQDQEGVVVATTERIIEDVFSEAVVDAVAQVVATPPPVKNMPAPSSKDFMFPEDEGEDVVALSTQPQAMQSTATAIGGAEKLPSSSTLPYLGLIGLISLVLFGVYAGKIG